MALLFGTLTLVLADDRFIKVKPTIVNALLGTLLLAGVVARRPMLKAILSEGVLSLSDRGWALLSRNYGLFFLLKAGLNELLWRSVSTDAWVSYDVWGDMGMTVLFTVVQLRLVRRHTVGTGSPVGGPSAFRAPV